MRLKKRVYLGEMFAFLRVSRLYPVVLPGMGGFYVGFLVCKWNTL